MKKKKKKKKGLFMMSIYYFKIPLISEIFLSTEKNCSCVSSATVSFKSEIASVMSSIMSTMTPSIPQNFCTYTTSGKLLQQCKK